MGSAALTSDEYRSLVDQAPVFLWRADATGSRDYFNARWLAFTGRALEQELGDGWTGGVHPDDLATCLEASSDAFANRRPFETRYRLRRHDGEYRWVLDRGTPTEFGRFLGSCAEVAAPESSRHQDERRLESLLRLEEMRDRPLQEVMDFGLEEAVRLTESRVGYLYFYDDAAELFTLYSWSSSVMKECEIAEKQTVYELHKTGLWGDTVRQRRPIVVNDFGADHPRKRGYPEGHVRLDRYLTVPVFEAGRIVAVAGMGNKSAPYDEDDVRQLQLYMNRLWSIVERQRAEEKVRLQALVLDQITDRVTVTDLDGTITYVNEAVAKALGQPKSELVGASVEAHGEDARRGPTQREIVERTLLDGRWEGEVVNRSSDGRERIVHLRTRVVVDAAGTPVALAGVGTDITDHRRTEGALRESEERFRLFMRHAPFVVAMKDRDSRLLYVNERFEEIFGVPPALALGRRKSELLPDEDVAAAEAAERACLEGDDAVRVVEVMQARGQKRHWDTVRFPIPEADGRRRILGIIAADVTDRVKAEDRERTYRARLQGLAAELSLAEERERRTIAAEMHDTVGQLMALALLRLGALGARCPVRACTADLDEMRQLIELALKDTRSLSFELSPPALYQLGLEPALEQLAEHVSARTGTAFEFADDGSPKAVEEGLKVLLYKATRELLVNVAKHARARWGRVAVSGDDRHLCIEVDDDGVGMYAEAAFPSREGGFGLFSIRERLRERGGDLQVEARPGGGTRVRLRAPLDRASGR